MPAADRPKVLLRGYFDNNFGDDYMMKIMVREMSGFDFYVENSRFLTALLTEEKNVHIAGKELASRLPVLIITGSGFMINSRKALCCELKWLLQRRHIGDWCIGCNIEPFGSRFREWLIARKLSKFKLIICRDKSSFAWLRKHCKGVKIYCLPDILFSLPDSNIKAQPSKLGIALFRRGGDPGSETYYKKMAEAADYWIERSGEDVLLMAFDTGTENDTAACAAVKELMKHGEKAVIINHGTNGEIIKAFSECKKVIAARFHACVLAVKMNIDLYPVVYRSKIKNLIDDIGYPEQGCFIDSIDMNGIKKFLNEDRAWRFPEVQKLSSAHRYAEIFTAEYFKEYGACNREDG